MHSEDSETQVLSRGQAPAFLTKTRFDSFDLPKEVRDGIDDAGFGFCSPIQELAIPVALEGKDVAGQAQTGTGKTAAFLVPILTHILHKPDKKVGFPSALIVAPTRELAIQIYDDALMLGAHTGVKCGLAIGGMDYGKQAQALRDGLDILIGTPGRIIDFYKQKIFKTEGVHLAVIDEADRLLDMGFSKDMRFILRKLPHYSKRQTMLFSATMSYRVLELTYEFMKEPQFLSVAAREVAVDGIEQCMYHVGKDQKLSLLLGLLDREDWTRVLIFVNTKSGVEFIAKKLAGNGLPAEAITGDLPQKKRLSILKRFKEGDLKILVATDVASRGIHVEDISHVINYDIPQDPENYVHRIGRTARAGAKGHALTLACEDFVYFLEPLEEYLKDSIPIVWPEDDWYIKDKAGPVKVERRGPKPGQKGGGRPGRGNGPRAGRNRPGQRRSQAPKKAASDQPKKKRRRRRRKPGNKPGPKPSASSD